MFKLLIVKLNKKNDYFLIYNKNIFLINKTNIFLFVNYHIMEYQFIECPLCKKFSYFDTNDIQYFYENCNYRNCDFCSKEMTSGSIVTNCGHVFCKFYCWSVYIDLFPKDNTYTSSVSDNDSQCSDIDTISNKNISSNCVWYSLAQHYKPIKPSDKYKLNDKKCGWCDRKAKSWVKKIGRRCRWSACCAEPND